ncbi:PREDICTED: protein-arginine deiminase type-2-like [Nanorana parkeri]|uniref:protein-arginine deiminase type-2-like n=1 Tax=Nanorana parkeri TaxID=125878 RepID=UPI0008542A3C|nr:PREDICTED: protein-arginine deiminase type-2-like [Nanorana parkeri]
MESRTLRLERGQRLQAVCVLGTRLVTDINGGAPVDCKWFSMRHSPNIEMEILGSDASQQKVINGEKLWPLSSKTMVEFHMTQHSAEINDGKITIAYYGKGADAPVDKSGVYLTGIGISLDVDADRDGVVEKNNPHKASWTWGPDGQGAILLVNCDKDSLVSRVVDGDDNLMLSKSDLLDMSKMILRIHGPEKLPTGYLLMLHVSPTDARSLGVFYLHSKVYTHVLGRRKLFYKTRYTGTREMEFYVEGLRFPDEGFNGLVSIKASLLETQVEGIPETPIFTDSVTFRISPLIITPSTLAPIEVYVCSVKENYLFLKAINRLVNEAKLKVQICFEYVNRGDRWMQDEMEFGYIQAPHQSFPVVLDSPRDRGLKDFPIRQLLGPDFGYVTKVADSDDVTSLDSFGNLEVSPPVTVGGKKYPLGRILIGSSFPTTSGRRMTKVVRDFLYAQQVQEPIELFSDWLLVGHVDEFLTFVPAPNGKGFRLLLASPATCLRILQEKKQEGHGDVILLQGFETKRWTVSKVLSTDVIVMENAYAQHCIDWNRDILKRELGLTEDDIIDIPALFKLQDGKACAFFPNMVNMIVLGKILGIPKPYGPVIKETCCLEDYVIDQLKPLELSCSFIDDVVSYHKQLGEVHCGTNVRRKPFSFKWWQMEKP